MLPSEDKLVVVPEKEDGALPSISLPICTCPKNVRGNNIVIKSKNRFIIILFFIQYNFYTAVFLPSFFAGVFGFGSYRTNTGRDHSADCNIVLGRKCIFDRSGPSF